jgi:hypothetical protein
MVVAILCFNIQRIPNCNLVWHVVRGHSRTSSVDHAKAIYMQVCFCLGEREMFPNVG